MKLRIICMLLALAAAAPLSAQQDSVPPSPPERGFAQPFWGGVIGSTLGVIGGTMIGFRLNDCEDRRYNDSDFCEFGTALAGAAAGTAVGAAVGAYIGGRLTGGDPSPIAASIGSLLGIGAGGLAAWGAGHLFGETDAAAPIVLVTFVVTHGSIAALFTSRSMEPPEEWQR